MMGEREDLKALQKIWYARLKEEGFRDIEYQHNDLLNQYESTYFHRFYTPEEFQENLDYYRAACHFYWNYKDFKTELEKEIWRLHSEGISRRRISVHFLQHNLKISDSSVQLIIAKLKKIMQSGLWPSEAPYDDDTDDS